MKDTDICLLKCGDTNCVFKKLNKQVEVLTRQLEKANKEVILEKEKGARDRQRLEAELNEHEKQIEYYKQKLKQIKEIVIKEKDE